MYRRTELGEDDGPLCTSGCTQRSTVFVAATRASRSAACSGQEAGGGQLAEGGQVRPAEFGDGEGAVVSAAVEPAEFDEATKQSRGQAPGQVRFPFGPVEAVAGQHPS